MKPHQICECFRMSNVDSRTKNICKHSEYALVGTRLSRWPRQYLKLSENTSKCAKSFRAGAHKGERRERQKSIQPHLWGDKTGSWNVMKPVMIAYHSTNAYRNCVKTLWQVWRTFVIFDEFLSKKDESITNLAMSHACKLDYACASFHAAGIHKV